LKRDTPGTRIVLKSSAQQTGCGVLPSGTTRCTGSRRLQRAADLIGDFSGNGILESVRVQGGPISCVVSDSTTCRLEPELAELAGSTEWAAVQMRPNGTTAIFAIVGTTLRICARSSPGGRFVCAAREAAPELTQFSAWVVRKFQRGIFFDGIAFVPAMSSLRPTLPGLADEANALARSLYDAVTPSQHKEIFVNLVDGSSFPYGPSFEDFWEENCPGCGSHVYEWSDMWGFYWFDFRSATSIPNPTACLACDTDRANAYVYCSVAAAVLGGACFGAGTLFALSTGPVGLAGAGIILGATGLCLSGAEFLCLSVADQRLGNCRATSC